MRLFLWLLELCGFTKQYALVSVAEWEKVQIVIGLFRPELFSEKRKPKHQYPTLQIPVFTETTYHQFNDVLAAHLPSTIDELYRLAETRRMAEEAHVAAVQALPVSAVVATKIGDEMAFGGLPEDPDPSRFMTKK